MIEIYRGSQGPEPQPSAETRSQHAGQPEEPEITLYPQRTERQEPPTEIIIPQKLAKEILPTILYLYEREYTKFTLKRCKDPLAILLDPERIKTEREEQRIDEEIQKKIDAGEATNREEAMQKLLQEHIYAPPLVQNYIHLIRGLNEEKPIDISFLEQQLRSRYEHEDGIAKGEHPHWTKPTPPTRRERQRAIAERNKMIRFLAALAELKRQQQNQEQTRR